MQTLMETFLIQIVPVEIKLIFTAKGIKINQITLEMAMDNAGKEQEKTLI